MIRKYFDHPLRDLNSFHVEERADCIIEFDRKEDLDEIFAEGNTTENWYVLGGGNNILFTKRFEGTLIHPAGRNITVLTENAEQLTVEVESAVEWDNFVAWCVERELWGAENLSLIPGKVGASPVQNIGAYGAEAKDVISRVHYFDTVEHKHLSLTNAECRFAYRDSIFKQELRGRAIITSVEFTLSKIPQPNLGYGDLARETEARGGATLKNIREAVCAIRRSKLPDTAVLGNAGSFFKNPVITAEHFAHIEAAAKAEYGPDYKVPHYDLPDGTVKVPAAWMIEQCGWKGRRSGGAAVYDKQPLVIVNYTGDAYPEEIVGLERRIIASVKAKFDIDLHPEVEHI